MNKVAAFLKESQTELRRVNWPSRDETIRYTWIVIVLSAFLTVVLGGLDYLFTYVASKYLL
ncbi:MAG: preprotein translocase subunit SecE [Candidatus Moranbacteria bacterium]|nr:preprotein translocase subunit SecE [Candidatus Moranbacteria bacterium]